MTFCTYGQHSFSKVESALYKAIDVDNFDIVKLLFENKKLDINIIYKSKYDIKNDVENNKLIDHDCYNEKTAFYFAIEKGNSKIINLFLENDKLDINIPYKDYYYDEIQHEYLISEKTVLYASIENGNYNVVKHLLENENLDVNINRVYSYYVNRNQRIWINIDSKKIDLTEYGHFENTAFYAAVENANIEIVKLLLQNENIDINIPCKAKIKIQNHILLIIIRFKIIFIITFNIKNLNEIR